MTFDDMLCRDVVEVLTDYLEGALSTEARERLELHIASCPGCEGYLEQFRTTIRMTGQLRPDDVSPGAMEDLVDVFRAWHEDPSD